MMNVLYRFLIREQAHCYGTQECDQDRLGADELEDRVVESLLATLARRDLLEGAVERWGEIVEANRPGREQELIAVEAQIRRAQASLDRYCQAFEEGRLRQEVCTRRIEELSAELTSLEARRSELAEEISGVSRASRTPPSTRSSSGTSSAPYGTERRLSARL